MKAKKAVKQIRKVYSAEFKKQAIERSRQPILFTRLSAAYPRASLDL